MKRTVDEITGSRRLRRLRKFSWSRRLVRETRLHVADLVWTLFLCEGENQRRPIASMPGVSCLSVDIAVEECLKAAELGIVAIAPFAREPLSRKSDDGAYIAAADNLTNRFTRALKQHKVDIGIITDAALDPYTTHGHDGICRNGIIVNDESVEMVVRGALAQAEAGADIIAPSDMMDGRIGAIRDCLDIHGFQDVAIMSYAAKFASAFYGPYREAIGTSDLLRGDKSSYYVDHANSNDALREVEQDLNEGADMLMVKPGLLYLDIIRRIKDNFSAPLFAYQVSGEYAMLQAASANGWLDGERAMMETLLAFKRAGCDGIFTYYAIEAAKKLRAASEASA
ncbi:MAG: porphobilinogen synthase [Candidatus Tokpelaia sp.]|uniref:porphobilinogen synthase n=1 Tax=Candidatus Tokpelaia sp. TaxID=2233777 RepID=UPI001239BF51|nr:porphobilinogen synthase [Candidatus Tokpelaia sp.]KAA6205874.1 MAG: porphobilinogen synthase [Candidatus Tokpelaia sp.]KAA6207724.1 MAG: porphobilinogen synthase [Candidatus Tokpelaia sp.]KAA6404898.1 porphobilinogen synthase [Candidatus Tokpelaia sp.]